MRAMEKPVAKSTKDTTLISFKVSKIMHMKLKKVSEKEDRTIASLVRTALDKVYA